MKTKEKDNTNRKNEVFIDVHILSGKISCFDPEIYIAQSWQRLAFMQDKVLLHDLLLIDHELMEIDLMWDITIRQKVVR